MKRAVLSSKITKRLSVVNPLKSKSRVVLYGSGENVLFGTHRWDRGCGRPLRTHFGNTKWGKKIKSEILCSEVITLPGCSRLWFARVVSTASDRRDRSSADLQVTAWRAQCCCCNNNVCLNLRFRVWYKPEQKGHTQHWMTLSSTCRPIRHARWTSAVSSVSQRKNNFQQKAYISGFHNNHFVTRCQKKKSTQENKTMASAAWKATRPVGISLCLLSGVQSQQKFNI